MSEAGKKKPRKTSRDPAKRPRIHTFVSTSPIHLAHQMRKSEEEVLAIISATIAQARNTLTTLLEIHAQVAEAIR